MGVRLDFEQISDCAHDKAVHDQSRCEGAEFRRDGVHVCLRVKWRLSILTGIKEQGPCRLKKTGKKGDLVSEFKPKGRSGPPRTVSADKPDRCSQSAFRGASRISLKYRFP